LIPVWPKDLIKGKRYKNQVALKGYDLKKIRTLGHSIKT